MGRRVLRRHIWGYSVCLCPIKGTPGLNELTSIPPLRILRNSYLSDIKAGHPGLFQPFSQVVFLYSRLSFKYCQWYGSGKYTSILKTLNMKIICSGQSLETSDISIKFSESIPRKICVFWFILVLYARSQQQLLR